MNKAIQPKTHQVKFTCTTCGAVYDVESTVVPEEVSIDVCSNCHPFYQNGNSEQKVKGRSEKLAAKFQGSAKKNKN
ncbi:MAG: 50S ribosomal protein L31 [Mycoplasmataceae bacterium]|jgi:large subunit ribosomal protein L31|nr:50S ribosomal protein L31 [Mycoplasmataceae bacterium]